MAYNRKSYEARCEAVRLWEQGISVAALAEQFGVTARTIYNWTQKAKQGQSLRDKRQGPGYRVPPEDIARMRQMYEAGQTINAIATATGWSWTTVSRVLARERIERREIQRDITLHLDVSQPGANREQELRTLLDDIEYYAQEASRIPGNQAGRRHRQAVTVRLTAWVGEE